MRSLLWFAIGVLGCVAPAVAGSITIALTPYSDPAAPNGAVGINLTINDTGGASGCTSIGIRRRAVFPCGGSGQVILCIPRQAGTRVLQFYDVVPRNTSYFYDAIGFGTLPAGVCGFQSDQYAFQQAFDATGWGFPIWAWTTVGPDPTPIAHGRLVQPVDASANFAIEYCTDSCIGLGEGFGSPDVAQYVGAGTEVFLYGTASYCCNCCGFLIQATSAVPQPCPPVSVEPRAWSNVKQLYR
jgi:hypothetical protein